MKNLNLRGLKLTLIGVAVTICGIADALLLYVGLAVMIVSLFVGDKIDTGEKEKNDTY